MSKIGGANLKKRAQFIRFAQVRLVGNRFNSKGLGLSSDFYRAFGRRIVMQRELAAIFSQRLRNRFTKAHTAAGN